MITMEQVAEAIGEVIYTACELRVKGSPEAFDAFDKATDKSRDLLQRLIDNQKDDSA